MEPTKKSYKGLAIISTILAVGLAAFVFFLLFKIDTLEKDQIVNEDQIMVQQEYIVKQAGEIEELIEQYEVMKTERDSLGLNNYELNGKIKKLGGYLSTIKKENKLNKTQLNEYNELIAQFQEDLKLKDEQLIKLKIAYDTLQSTSSLQKLEMQMMSEYMMDLEGKVQVASLLKTNNLTVNAINSKGKEYGGSEYRQKRVDKLKVNFTIEDNKVAEKGEKEVHFRLIDPSGVTITSGKTFVSMNGNQIVYTLYQPINFNNTNQSVEFIYTKGTEYKKGTYIVEIYIEGNLSGRDSFIVK
ncbi:MAG: hypothetical protein AB8B61_05280 [Cyclobacteriaceae bacterium]